MAGKCSKCSADFASGDSIAKCAECTLWFHPACTRLGSSQLIKTKLKTWKCDACVGESSSVSSVKSNDDVTHSNTQTIMEALSALKIEINSHTDMKVTEVTQSIGVLAQKFEKLEAKIKVIENEQEDLCKRCNTLEHDRDRLQDEALDLHQRLLDAEQHSRSANLEITGLPYTHNENVYEVLKKLAAVLKVSFKREDVSLAHRLSIYSKKHAHAPIVVQFVSRSVRETWMTAARNKRGINATEIAASLTPSMVYVNEQLTRHNKELLGRARRLVKERKIHFAGFFNGKVLIKPTADPGVKSIRVFWLKDLDKYDN